MILVIKGIFTYFLVTLLGIGVSNSNGGKNEADALILRQKGTEYFNLALRFIICLFLDLPNTLGTKNWVMRSYILPLKKS